MKIFDINGRDSINFSNIIYSLCNTSKKNLNLIYLGYNLGDEVVPFIIRTPQLQIFSFNKIDFECFSYELLLSLSEDDGIIGDFFKDLENVIINYLRDNFINSHDQIFKSLIKELVDENNKSTNVIKLKLLSRSNIKTYLYDTDSNIISPTNLNIYDKVKTVIQIVAIWRKENVFGIYIRPHQIKKSNNK